MSIDTERYIRKPLYVDAVRLTAGNFDEMAVWCQGEVQTEEVPGTGKVKKFIRVRVQNPMNPRQTKAFVGDWLLYTDSGYKVYTTKAFYAAFDKVILEEAANGKEHIEIASPEAEAAASNGDTAPNRPLETFKSVTEAEAASVTARRLHDHGKTDHEIATALDIPEELVRTTVGPDNQVESATQDAPQS